MSKYIIIAIVGILLISGLMPCYIRVKGHSMYPTLQDRGVYRVIPKPFARKYSRGDIVVVYVQGFAPYVKRIIAVGGDKLQITRYGSIAVNSEWIKEPYILPQKHNGKAIGMVIPDGCYYVMGDNRGKSTDSRHFGVLERWRILGKVILKEKR